MGALHATGMEASIVAYASHASQGGMSAGSAASAVGCAGCVCNAPSPSQASRTEILSARRCRRPRGVAARATFGGAAGSASSVGAAERAVVAGCADAVLPSSQAQGPKSSQHGNDGGREESRRVPRLVSAQAALVWCALRSVPSVRVPQAAPRRGALRRGPRRAVRRRQRNQDAHRGQRARPRRQVCASADTRPIVCARYELPCFCADVCRTRCLASAGKLEGAGAAYVNSVRAANLVEFVHRPVGSTVHAFGVWRGRCW